MKAPVSDPAIPPAPQVFPSPEADQADPGPSLPRGPIRYRFVQKFAAQLSTPCSRGLAIKPRAGRVLARRAPRLFQSYLQRHSVLQ